MTPTETAAILRHFNEWRRCDEDIPQPDTREIGEAIDAAVEMIERLEAAESDALEQARLNGMGASREAALMAKLEAAEKERDALRVDKATLQQMLYSIKNRLEAAERSDAESVAMYRKARDERDALRAAVRHEADCVEAAMAEIKSLRAKIEAMERQEPVGVLHVGSCYGEELEDWEFEADQRVCDRLNERHVTNPTSLKLYALPGAQPAPSVPTALLVAVADLVAQMEIVSRVGFIDTPDDKDSCAAFCVAEGTWLELMSAIESLASALAAAPEAKP